MKTFLCEESVLRHNKRNGFQSYPDHYLKTNADNRPFAASHSRGTKTPCWRAKVALGQDKHRKLPFQIMYVFCLSCPSATFALQRGGFVPREWLAAKGLLFEALVCPQGFLVRLVNFACMNDFVRPWMDFIRCHLPF